jgi:transcriptional regulator with XRE-family HTH domain
MNSVKYLLELQARKGLSDTGLATLLGVSQPAISQYKAKKRVMDDETCLAVALQLDIDPMQVLGAAFLDRAEKTGQKSLWEVFMNRAAMTTGAVLVASGVNLFLTPAPANAAAMRVSENRIPVSIDYAKRARRRQRGSLDAIFAWSKRVLGPTALLTTAS